MKPDNLVFLKYMKPDELVFFETEQELEELAYFLQWVIEEDMEETRKAYEQVFEKFRNENEGHF